MTDSLIVLEAPPTPIPGARELHFPGTDHPLTLVRAEAGPLLDGVSSQGILEDCDLRRDRNPYLVYLRSLSNDESRRAMRGCLDRIANMFAQHAGASPTDTGEDFPWHRLRFAHTAAMRALIAAQPWAPAYANKHLAALRRVLRYAWKLDLLGADDYQRATDLDRIKGRRLPAGRSVAAAELEALLRACVNDDTPAGVRDAAIIAALYSTGCRRSEMADARREDYEPAQRALRVIGKRNKEREVYLQESAASYVGRWLTVAGRRRGALFSPIHRWGQIGDGHMTADAIGKVMGKRAEESGVPSVSPHDLRRSFIGDLLDAGVDLATAQQLAGHASASTTAAYDRRPARTRQAAVDRLRVVGPEELAEQARGPRSGHTPQLPACSQLLPGWEQET